MPATHTALIALRLKPTLLARVDAYAAHLRATEPGPRWTRSATIRRLVVIALDRVRPDS